MLSKEEHERYNRQIILEGFGEKAQLQLKKAKVLIIGAGGLGCPALLYLTAAGIGTIGIADDDWVSTSNLHRQIVFDTNDTGKKKVVAAVEQLKLQNPHIHFTAYDTKISIENALKIIENYDLVIDGSDNFSTRYLVNDACVILNKPLIYGAIYQFEGQVSVFNYQNGPTYRCLFPEPPASGEMPACGIAGVLGVLPGIVGSLQAAEAIKVITGVGKPLAGILLKFDLLSNSYSTFQFETNSTNKKITQLTASDFCGTVKSLPIQEWNVFSKKNKCQLIDVREKNEYAEKNLKGRNIPLSELEERMSEINPDIITVVHCKSGTRSLKAIDLIEKRLPGIKIYNLTNYQL